MSHDDHHREFEERALRNVRDLVDKLEGQKRFGWRTEKQLLLLFGVLLIAIVGFVGLSMVLGSSREKDERHRCEMDRQVALVWEHKKKLKAEHPDFTAAQIDADVNANRPQIREAAKKSCAGE